MLFHKLIHKGDFMQNNWNFSTCISQLLNILNVSSNKLAKSINVDPSLVSRWKTGKRKISDESSYLKPMADHFSDKIFNDYQKTSIINIASKFNLPIDIRCSNNMSEYIYILMVSSIQSSVHFKDYSKNTCNSTLNEKFKADFLLNENVSFSSCNINNKSSHMQQFSFGNNEYISSFEVITGHSNVINVGINLLKSLPKKPDLINESILITFLTEIDSFSNFENTYYEWNNALIDVQKKGWNINKLININENINRNMKIINEFLVNIMSKRYHPYYLNKYDSIMKLREFIIIPSVGTLVCLCSENPSKINSAFLIKDAQASKVLKGAFDLCIEHTKPLINSRFTTQNISLLTEIENYEKLRGDRFTFNCCLNYELIPMELIEKFLFLDKEKMPQKEIFKRDYQYKKIKKAFDMQIKNYKFLNIYSKSFIENLIKVSKSPLTPIETSDILKFFENIVFTLKKYDNYSIGLLNDDKAECLSNFSWMVKDSNVLLTNYVNTNKEDCSKSYVSISEPNIVNTFKKYFDELWSEIAPINKEKESVISWFQAQIKGLSNL